MENIGDRIKQVRKEKGLTQQKFADTLGLKRNTVGGYEIGGVAPSERTILDICEKFNVNEIWLRTGEGEMFIQLSRDEEVAAFLGKVMSEENSFRHRMISVLSRLDTEEWALIERMAQKLLEETKNQP